MTTESVLWCLIRFLLPAIACSCILPLASCSFSCFQASDSISCHLASCLLASCSFASCFLPLLALASCLLFLVPNVSFWTDSKLQPSSLQNLGLAQAFGLRLPVPKVCFWTSRNKLQIAAFKPPKPWPRHTETPCNWRTDQAFGLRLPVPDVVFWTDKQLAPNCSFQASKTLASPHRNTMQMKDGPGLQPAAACAWRCFLNRQATSSKLQPSTLQNLGLATPKNHATEGRTRPGLRLSEPTRK